MRYLLGLIFIFVSGCSTLPYIRFENANYSLAAIGKAVNAVVPGGIKRKSTNGRELHSDYFNPKDDQDYDPEKAKVRAVVRVVILGERRPYDLDVLVRLDRRIDGSFEIYDYDERLANKYLQLIRQRLAQSREELNVIDDFKAF